MPGSLTPRLDGRAPRDGAGMPALRERAAPSRPAAEAAGTAPGVPAREMVPLTALARDATGVVAGVRVAPPGAAAEPDPVLERMALRLIEIGFVRGERLRVVAFGQPGDDPIGVRIGGRGGSSIFALRRQEAGCVWVWPDR
jgi:ferrous iron transport protein A